MQNRWLLPAAFAAIYLVWGSTYLVNFLAIATIPPFLMSGSRFLAAGVLMLFLAKALHLPAMQTRQWQNAAVSGVFLLSVGTGGVVWAEQFVPTGIAALLVASQPLVTVLLLWRIRHIRPRWNSWVGIALGFLGMSLLVGQDAFISGPNMGWGILVIFISIVSWALASIWIGKWEMPASSVQAAAVQMVTGGLVLLVFSVPVGEWNGFSFSQVSRQSFFSWLYLIFLGSILAFSAFNYLLVRVRADRVSTTTYVNPVIALFLGWAFNAEKLSGQSLLAALILLSGVVFINTRFKQS